MSSSRLYLCIDGAFADDDSPEGPYPYDPESQAIDAVGAALAAKADEPDAVVTLLVVACTGHIDPDLPGRGVQHDGETCPIHEGGRP